MNVARSLLLVSLCVGATAPARAQDDVAAFYRGRQLRMMVGSAVGGGYDLLCASWRATSCITFPAIPA